MKKKRIFATIMASLMSISMMSAFPMGASAAATEYSGLISTDTTNSTPSNDAWLQYKISQNNITATNDLISYNATEFKKVLEIEDTANIPACSFTYTVTAPSTNIPATYNGTDVKTLAVFPGVGADAIQYKLENVANDAFVTNSNENYSEDGLSATTGSSTTLSYDAQAISLPTNGSQKSVDDNVLINNITPTGDSEDTYYAIKTIQMDFTDCGFTEPGIYRYYIQETGDNQGITNDYTVTDTNDNCWRTIDVYVEDATYTTTGENATTNNKLRIAGYVMYVGKQTAGPKAGTGTENGSNTMEDGLGNTNPMSTTGGANGLEVDGATKSEGIKNIYETSDITFKKTVSGNQASKDKFFKFNIKLTDDATTISNVGDDDVFIINGTQVYNLDTTPADAKPNSATPYLRSTINDQNSATSYDEGNYIYVTGEELKAGYDFYLQDGQYVTIQGLPNGIGYELKEWQDDYTPTVTLKDTEAVGDKTLTYDNLNGGTSGTPISLDISATENGNVNNDPSNTASIKDTKITNDVYATFDNNRNGVLPTGIILSVGPTAIIGLALVGGIVLLIIRNKKRKLEE